MRRIEEQRNKSRAGTAQLVGKDGIGMTTKAGGRAKARREEVEYIRRHTRVPREVRQRETGMTPIKTGWPERDNQGCLMCARGGSRRKTSAHSSAFGDRHG